MPENHCRRSVCSDRAQQGSKLSRSADCRRQLWTLSASCRRTLCALLVLNLRGAASTLVGQLLNLMADSGEPCHLTVRQLRRADEAVFGEWNKRTVSVCENPASSQPRPSVSVRAACRSSAPQATRVAAQLLPTSVPSACRLRYTRSGPARIAIANMLSSGSPSTHGG